MNVIKLLVLLRVVVLILGVSTGGSLNVGLDPWHMSVGLGGGMSYLAPGLNGRCGLLDGVCSPTLRKGAAEICVPQ